MANFLIAGLGGDAFSPGGGGTPGSGIPGSGPENYRNDNPSNYAASLWPTLHDRTLALNGDGGRELMVWDHNSTTGVVSNLSKFDALLQSYKDKGLKVMPRIMPVNSNTWSEQRTRRYCQDVCAYIASSSYANTVSYILGINEPDSYNSTVLTNLNRWYYEGCKAGNADAKVVLPPLIIVNGSEAQYQFLTAKWHQYCDFADIHFYDAGMSPKLLNGADNTAYVGNILDMMQSSGIIKPLVLCEWGGGTDHASGGCTVLQWKAATHVMGWIVVAELGAVASVLYSVQGSQTASGAHNLWNQAGDTKPAGEADGERNPAWWAVKTLCNPSRYLLADFGGFNDIGGSDDIAFSDGATPAGKWRWCYPWHVNFYTRGQDAGESAWFEEWSLVTPQVGSIDVIPGDQQTLIRRYVNGLVVGNTYRVSVNGDVTEATRDATHYCKLEVKGYDRIGGVQSVDVDGAAYVEFTATNPWAVIWLRSRGLTVEWTDCTFVAVGEGGGGAGGEVGPFNPLALINGNSERANSADMADYQTTIVARNLSRSNGMREGWVTQVAHPNTLAVPAWLQGAAATVATRSKSLIVSSYPANAAGLPGTWSTAVSGTAAYTAAQDALAAWTTESLAASKSRHAVWRRNVKWNMHEKLRQVPEIFMLECQNEKNNTQIGSGVAGYSAADVAIRDFPAGLRASANATKLAVRRYALIALAAQELKQGIDLPAGASAITRPWAFGGPCFAEQEMEGGGAFRYGLRAMNQEWAAAYHQALDIVTGHRHRLFRDLTRFNGGEPGEQDNTLYNLWLYQREAVAIHGGSLKPIGETEGGMYWQTGTSGVSSYNSKMGSWNGGVVVQEGGTNGRGTFADLKSHGSELLKYEAHMPLWYHIWYGAIMHLFYSNNFSLFLALNHLNPSPTPLDVDGLKFRRTPHFEMLWNIQDPTRYDSRAWGAAFPVKPWTGFSEFWTWGVFKNDGKAPTATPLTEPPYDPWNFVKFGVEGVPVGQVELQPWTLAGHAKATTDQQMIAKPAWIAFPSAEHLFRVKVNFPDPATTSATRAKIMVRGANKLAGDIGQEVIVVGGATGAGGGTGNENWRTVDIPFRIQNPSGLAWPMANAVLPACQAENVTGYPVRFKEPELLW